MPRRLANKSYITIWGSFEGEQPQKLTTAEDSSDAKHLVYAYRGQLGKGWKVWSGAKSTRGHKGGQVGRRPSIRERSRELTLQITAGGGRATRTYLAELLVGSVVHQSRTFGRVKTAVSWGHKAGAEFIVLGNDLDPQEQKIGLSVWDRL
mgnify:CR=1 FL=1